MQNSSSDNLDQILVVLDKHAVEYIVVGGYGCILHGANTQTRDIDIVPKPQEENFDRLADALSEMNARLRGAEDVDIPITGGLLRNIGIGTWSTDHGDFDVIDGIPAGPNNTQYEFAELLKGSSEINTGNIIVYVASLEDIIASKRSANRPKDHKTLSELEHLLTQIQSDQSATRSSKQEAPRKPNLLD